MNGYRTTTSNPASMAVQGQQMTKMWLTQIRVFVQKNQTICRSAMNWKSPGSSLFLRKVCCHLFISFRWLGFVAWFLLWSRRSWLGGFGAPSSSSSRRMCLGLRRSPGGLHPSSWILLGVFDTDLQRHKIGAARRSIGILRGERLNGLKRGRLGSITRRTKALLLMVMLSKKLLDGWI